MTYDLNLIVALLENRLDNYVSMHSESPSCILIIIIIIIIIKTSHCDDHTANVKRGRAQ